MAAMITADNVERMKREGMMLVVLRIVIVRMIIQPFTLAKCLLSVGKP